MCPIPKSVTLLDSYNNAMLMILSSSCCSSWKNTLPWIYWHGWKKLVIAANINPDQVSYRTAQWRLGLWGCGDLTCTASGGSDPSCLSMQHISWSRPLSCISYCSSLLVGLSSCTFKPLKMTHNALVHLVFNDPKTARHAVHIPSLAPTLFPASNW